MSIVKDLRLYFSYKSIIKKNRVRLESDFNIRIDGADRLYTVINVPPDLIGEAYDLKKSDIDRISESYIKDYLSKIGRYLNSIGLAELYDFYEPIKKVDKLSYLIVLGFKPLNSVEINTIIYRILLPIIGISIIIGLFVFL
jgi:hypothetical protein